MIRGRGRVDGGGLFVLREELGLAGEDGAGALPIGAGGADGVGVGDGVVAVGRLNGEEAGGREAGDGGGRASGEMGNGVEEGMG